MNNNILNSKALQVFVILAESLDGWKNPQADEGKAVLLEHYAWAEELKANGKLLLAGPTDFDLTSTGKLDPIGHLTGLIMLKVETREEAEAWASKDPFQRHGFRKNVVHSLKISMTDNLLFDTLEKLML